MTSTRGHIVRLTAVVLLLLAASPVTQPFATIDLSHAPVAHESASGAVVKHKVAHQDSVVVVPGIVLLPSFLAVRDGEMTRAAAVRIYPLRASVLRL